MWSVGLKKGRHVLRHFFEFEHVLGLGGDHVCVLLLVWLSYWICKGMNRRENPEDCRCRLQNVDPRSLWKKEKKEKKEEEKEKLKKTLHGC